MIAPARAAALAALRAVATGRVDSGSALDALHRRLSDPRDRGLAAQIVLGTLRWRAALDAVIARVANRPVDAFDPTVLDVLRTGAYQLLFLTRTPPHAVVDDAVAMTREAGIGRATGLVNAVLRRISRIEGLAAAGLPPRPPGDASPADTLAYLATTLSHPAWLVGRWRDRLGFEAAERWARFDNETAPLVLRAHTGRISAADLQKALERHGVATRPTEHAPAGLVVTDGHPLATPLAAAGLFVVQNEASQLAAALMAALPGTSWLDLCAAPGLKTAARAGEPAESGDLLVAADIRPRRIALLRRTLTRLGIDARIVRLDALAPLPFRATFDVVILDAPCSGLGVLRRDPEIRWRRTPADLPRFAAMQGRMLDRATDAVAEDGHLVYATCSGEPEENDEVVEGFLRRHPGFHLVDAREACRGLPAGVRRFLDPAGVFRTVPSRDDLEAFFAAVIVRRR